MTTRIYIIFYENYKTFMKFKYSLNKIYSDNITNDDIIMKFITKI